MNNIYLISEQMVRTESLIGNNVDSAYLLQAINYAQMIDLQEVLGTQLYKSILLQVEVHAFKSEEYHTLLEDYIQPYLVQQVMSEIVIPLVAKFRNAGIVASNDTHYSGLSINDATKVREEYAHKASFLANRITEYIVRNIEAFYADIEDDSRFITLRMGKTKCPIFFGDGDEKTYCKEDDLY